MAVQPVHRAVTDAVTVVATVGVRFRDFGILSGPIEDKIGHTPVTANRKRQADGPCWQLPRHRGRQSWLISGSRLYL